MKIDVRVSYLDRELVYSALFSGEAHGKELFWFVYVPDRFVISENGQHRLTGSAMEVLKPVAELAIEMDAVRREREESR